MTARGEPSAPAFAMQAPLWEGWRPLPPQPPGSMNTAVPALADFRRIVVKVGSSLLVDSSAGRVRASWLASLAADIAALHGERRDILIVSSGAIALGRSILRLPAGSLRLED